MNTPSVSAFIFEQSWRSWDSDELASACSHLVACGVGRLITETWTLDPSLIEAVHAHGMELWSSVACYSDHNQPVRVSRPELTPVSEKGTLREQQEWYVGLIPTDERYNRELVQRCADIVGSYDVDGFILDFIRWPLHWELELRSNACPLDSSFDLITLTQFRQYDPEFPEGLIGKEAAAHILEQRLDTWISFKCETVSSLAARIHDAVKWRRPDIATGLFVVPGDDGVRRRYVGQDVGCLGSIVDELLPMTYHRIVEQDVGWIEDTVATIRTVAPDARVTPVVQVTADRAFAGEADWGRRMTADDARRALARAKSVSSDGAIVVFPGEALLVGSAAERLRTAVRLVSGGAASE